MNPTMPIARVGEDVAITTSSENNRREIDGIPTVSPASRKRKEIRIGR
jgi:hypothetical protein